MQRRQFVTGLAAAAAVATSGCLGDEEPADDEAPDQSDGADGTTSDTSDDGEIDRERIDDLDVEFEAEVQGTDVVVHHRGGDALFPGYEPDLLFGDSVQVATVAKRRTLGTEISEGDELFTFDVGDPDLDSEEVVANEYMMEDLRGSNKKVFVRFMGTGDAIVQFFAGEIDIPETENA